MSKGLKEWWFFVVIVVLLFVPISNENRLQFIRHLLKGIRTRFPSCDKFKYLGFELFLSVHMQVFLPIILFLLKRISFTFQVSFVWHHPLSGNNVNYDVTESIPKRKIKSAYYYQTQTVKIICERQD